MILHLEDWKAYPTAIVDYTTKNETFLNLVSLYRKMGIKNHLWPLTLLNPVLQGVDPHDPNLSDEMKTFVRLECENNPWYYFREVVRIPPQAGKNWIRFKANRGNMAMLWCYFNSIDFVLIQPRQTGKSVSTDTLMILLIYILARSSELSLITKDDKLRRTNVDRLKKIREGLPKYLVPITKDDSDNQYELTCNFYKNKYTTGVAQNSEFAANNLGRGSTTPTRHIDEGPFISFIGTTLPAALAAGTAAREEAELNNQPCGNIFTTTAGKKDDRDGRFMYEFIHEGAYWNEKFMDAGNKDFLKRMIATNASGRKVLVNGTFSHRQLGKTDEWLMNAMAEAYSKGEVADRDFLNVWTSGTQRSPLSPELNDRIRNSEADVLHTVVTKDFYMVNWYLEEDQIPHYMNQRQTVLTIDSSEAVGRDAIAITIEDIRTLEVIATANINETNILRFSQWLAEFMIQYQNTTMIIEKKSTGQSIIDTLLVILPKYGIDPFKRIYNRLVEASDTDDEAWNIINTPMDRRSFTFYDRFRNKFGFNTTAESRHTLYRSVLPEAAKIAGHLVRDKQLINEILGLVVKNDRIDHAASGHDDMVISWLLGCWFLSYSRNLSHYGIDSSQVLSEVRKYGRELTEEEARRIEEQKYIKAEIQGLLDQLSEEQDNIQSSIIEHRLQFLSQQLTADEAEVNSIDDLIKQVKEVKEAQMQLIQRRNAINFNRNVHWSEANRWNGGWR